MAIPIWKDKFVNLGSYASRYFRIRVGGTTIYSGRAYRAASSGSLYVRINDVCADYMGAKPLPVPYTSGPTMTFPVSFTVQGSANGSSWSTVETVQFNDDWSYENGFDPSVSGFAFPVTGRIDLRQRIYQTRYTGSSVTAVARYGSTTRNVSLTVQTSPPQSAFFFSLCHAGAGYVVFDCAAKATYDGKTLTAVTIGAATYVVAKTCPKKVLYYKNPFGGYDHLLIEGNATRSRSVQRETFVADYDNDNPMRERWDFQNEVTEAWTLNTGLLTLDESARMPYLLDSPQVFLCDLDNPQVVIPALVVTDSYQAETYAMKGTRMKNHTFDVRIAQNELKR